MIPDSNAASGLGVSPADGLNMPAQPPVAVGASVDNVTPSPVAVSPISVEGVVGAEAQDLEQDWVEKAKDIVERTKADPFTQSIELNKVKAEFLKARYDKQINIAEDKPQ